MTCYDEYAGEYDSWFLANENLLTSEVRLVAQMLREGGDILSIGCGSGLFEKIMADDFGITVREGVEPSEGMATIARKRGMEVVIATAGDFKPSKQYDTVLMNGCPSYIDDLDGAFANVAKALKPSGRIVVADVPKESAYALVYNLAMTLGTWNHQLLEGVKPKDPYPIEFVKSANWRTTAEKIDALRRAGFIGLEFCQTLTMNPASSDDYIENPVPGCDKGSYVAIAARKAPVFLQRLKDGSLDEESFRFYVYQDALYLGRHAETLRILADKLENPYEKRLFLNYAEDGVAAEKAMQRDFIGDEKFEDMGWGANVLEFVKSNPASLGIAAVAPCFSVYADAGRYLAGTTGKYASWVAAYASESFAADAEKVACVLRSHTALHPEFSSQIADIVRRGIDAEVAYWNKSLKD